MKGLIYKELYLGRKSYFSFLAMALLFTILGILVCVSMNCGNLQELAKDLEWKKTYALLFSYVPYVLILFSLLVSNQSVYKDYESGWMSYSYTLPTDVKIMMGSRYLVGACVLVVSLIYGIINVGIISAITGLALTVGVAKNMVVIVIIASVIYACIMPMALKYKTSNAVSTRCVIVGAVGYVLLFIKMIDIERNGTMDEIENYYKALGDKYESIRDVVAPFSPLLIAFILLIGFLISIKIYRRREK